MKKVLFLCLIVLCLVSCVEKPDLIVTSEMTGYCEIDDMGQLVVNVQNNGSVVAPSSVTRIEFGSLGGFELPTPIIESGQSARLTVPIPMGCFNPDCGFKITVDALNAVQEKREDNNIAIGNCIG